MTDTIINGSGNSRSIKAATNIPATWEAFRAQLISSGIPIDLGPINPAGLRTRGTDLGKASLLSDGTETSIWGAAADRTVDAALAKLKSLVSMAQSTADSRAEKSSGSYTGTGNLTKGITLGIDWTFFIMSGRHKISSTIWNTVYIAVKNSDMQLGAIFTSRTDYSAEFSYYPYEGYGGNNGIQFTAEVDSRNWFNAAGYLYRYMALR